MYTVYEREGGGKKVRERERREGEREEAGKEQIRERVHIPVGMLIALDTVQNKSLVLRIHLVCVNQHTVHTGDS
jgi:hypothetical protein